MARKRQYLQRLRGVWSGYKLMSAVLMRMKISTPVNCLGADFYVLYRQIKGNCYLCDDEGSAQSVCVIGAFNFNVSISSALVCPSVKAATGTPHS